VLSTRSRGHYNHSQFTIISVPSQSMADTCPLPRCLWLWTFGVPTPLMMPPLRCSLWPFTVLPRLCLRWQHRPVPAFVPDRSFAILQNVSSVEKVNWLDNLSEASSAWWSFVEKTLVGLWPVSPTLIYISILQINATISLLNQSGTIWIVAGWGFLCC
jgi:hypothetical protein